MPRALLLLALALSGACTTSGQRAVSQGDLKAKGTHVFDGVFEDVYDAAYLVVERYEGHIASADRMQGVFENDKVQFSAPPGWDGDAFRNYAVSVYQDGSRVAVTAVPRLWAGERDVSDQPLWQLGGMGGEDEHWERMFDNIQDLLKAWRSVPELELERSRGEVSVLGVRWNAPSDWRELELTPDHHQAIAQLTVHGTPGCPECPGGLNPTIVFEIERRHPAADAPRLQRTAMEQALGPQVVEPEAWSTEDSQSGRKGTGQVVAGDGKTTAVTWHVWDAGELAWMVRAAAACGSDGAAACDLAWEAMINGVVTEGHR